MVDQITREVNGEALPACWVVGPRSMMVDRVVPRLEFLWMPKTVQPGGKITLVRDRQGVAPERRPGWKGYAHRVVRKDVGADAPAATMIDLRVNYPENWAHAQIFHVPLAAMAREWLGAAPTVLLTFATPQYVRSLFRLLGFQVIATDRAVYGDVITPIVSSNDVLRPARRSLVQKIVAELDDKRGPPGTAHATPSRIFVSRKKTRRIENEGEVIAFLATMGFQTVYPEDLSVGEQLDLFNNAHEIVAIHGAALAPLLFRSPTSRPVKLIEILSPGHVANSYRLMAAQIGGSYVGVRGRAKPAYIDEAYRLDQFFTKYSLDDFTVDIASLQMAIEISETGAPPEFVA